MRASVQKYVAGLDDFIPLLDRLALIFAVVDHGLYQPISILILRAIEDFQVGIFLTLCQVQGDVVELMRDVLEIELLIREFRHDKAGMKDWMNADPERRKNFYSANALRQRHANRIGVNAKDLPDASDYKLHSQALHISPLSQVPPFKLRGINLTDDPFAVDLGFRELFYHAESLLKTTTEFCSAITGKNENFEKSLARFREAAILAKLAQEIYYGIQEAMKNNLGAVPQKHKTVHAKIEMTDVLEKHKNAFASICSGCQLVVSCELLATPP